MDRIEGSELNRMAVVAVAIDSTPWPPSLIRLRLFQTAIVRFFLQPEVL